MSPGSIMLRAYSGLKRRIMDGEFAPGARLDPARLRDDLAASTTPIRDALHRLTGEGLVESWQNEGFRVPHVSEAVIRDGYEWGRLLIRTALAHAAVRPEIAWPEQLPVAGYAEQVTVQLLRVATLTANHEIRRAIANLCDRAYPLRPIEVQLCPDAVAEVSGIECMACVHDWGGVATAFDRFYDRRIEIVPLIAGAMRS